MDLQIKFKNPSIYLTFLFLKGTKLSLKKLSLMSLWYDFQHILNVVNFNIKIFYLKFLNQYPNWKILYLIMNVQILTLTNYKSLVCDWMKI